MSCHLPRMFSRGSVRAAGVAVMLAASAGAVGQASRAGVNHGDDAKVEIYGGYGFWDPFDNGIAGNAYPKLYQPNVTGSLSVYFTRHFGVQAEGSYFSKGRSLATDGVCNDVPCSPVGQRLYTAEGGPVFRYPLGRVVPFAHVLGGGVRLSGPVNNPLTWGWGVTGGVGVDYVLPYFHNLLAVRPIQADFQYQHVDYGTLFLPANTNGGVAGFPALKLSGGLVVRFGGRDMDHTPHGGLMLGCDATPRTAYVGDHVTVTAIPVNLNTRKGYRYSWSTDGGKTTTGEDGASTTATTTGPGDYTVIGRLTQGRQHAECTANYTVLPVEPPTLSCSADPATVPSGGAATITATGVSAAGRALMYSFTSDFGQVTGSGNRVQLATAGVTAPTITVTCTVTDDLGKTAQATTQVGVTTGHAAVLPPLTDVQTLCGVSFDRDRRRPVRVDNEAKACLDDIALTMQRQTDARLVIVGDYGAREGRHEGEERALNVRQYLTEEKGVEGGRIEVRYGDGSGRKVDDTLVPAGVSYPSDRGTVFDPVLVRRFGQAYGRAGQRVGQRAGHEGRAEHRRHGRRRHRVEGDAGLTTDQTVGQPVVRRHPKGRRRYRNGADAAAGAKAAGQVPAPVQ